jgi:hypothetical protein
MTGSETLRRRALNGLFEAVAIEARRVLVKAVADEVAPASDRTCTWQLPSGTGDDDDGYPAELVALAHLLDELDAVRGGVCWPLVPDDRRFRP